MPMWHPRRRTRVGRSFPRLLLTTHVTPQRLCLHACTACVHVFGRDYRRAMFTTLETQESVDCMYGQINCSYVYCQYHVYLSLQRPHHSMLFDRAQSSLTDPVHMRRRHTPRMMAAVPVQTPLDLVSMSLDSASVCLHSHQPLQRGKLDLLQPLSQCSSLLLNSRLDLLDLQLLRVGLLPDPSLFQI